MAPGPWVAYPGLMAQLGEIGIQSGYALIVIALLALPVAASAFARSGPSWESLGKGRWSIHKPLPPPARPLPPPPVDRAVQAAEARQMLEAKSYRRRQRGLAPIDVEAELERLLSGEVAEPDLDQSLRAEIRQLVVARNERRMRTGRSRST
jgi:hypothetical protein